MSDEYFLQNVDMTVDQDQVSDGNGQVLSNYQYNNYEAAGVNLSELNLESLGFSDNAVEESKPEENIVFFRVNGSEEVYGIQKVVDEDGNEQKCQFQVRQTSDGQYEPIPESIQVLHSNEEYVESNDHSDIGPIYFKEEYLVVDQSEKEQNELMHNTTLGPDEEDLLGIFMKTENEEQSSNEPIDFEEEYLPQPNFSDLVQEATSVDVDAIVDDESQNVYEQDPLEGYGNQLLQDAISTVVVDEQSIENNLVNAYVGEASIDESRHLIVEEAAEETVVDSEIYLGSLNNKFRHLVQETIASTVEEDKKSEHYVNEETQARYNRETRVFITDENNQQYSYVVKSTGKENVTKTPYRINPRSVLKSSVLSKRAVKPVQRCQTKILEAPVRTQRLPRKQKIQPIVRSGEEIVLQEIVVSSNGYLRITEDGVLQQNKMIVPKEYVQLSDSDEDGRCKKRRKKFKKQKNPPVEITIIDSDEG